MSKENKNPFLHEKEKKRHLWGLWIPLMIIGGIIIVPLAIAMIFFFDPGHYDTGVKEAVEPQALVDNITGSVFDNCRAETDQSMGIVVKQDTLNQVMLKLCNDLNAQVSAMTKQFVVINQLDMQILDNNIYLFEGEATAFSIFKSRLVISMEVDGEAMIETASGLQKGLTIKMLDVKFGRLGGLFSIVEAFFNIDNFVQQLKTNNHINLSWNKTTKTLSYTYIQAISDLGEMISSGAGSGSSDMVKLLTKLLGVFVEKDYISFPSKAGEISMHIPISDFKKNDTYYSSSLTLGYVEEEGKQVSVLVKNAEKIDALLNANIITESRAKTYNNLSLDQACLAVHKFITFGIDFVTGTSQINFVNALFNDSAFKNALNIDPSETIESYSAARRLEYFGYSNTSFLDEIKDNAANKVTYLFDNADDTINGVDIMDVATLIEMLINGEIDSIPDVTKEDLKTYALFSNIKSKINNGGWYLFGGDYTTYYYDNNLTNWKQIYAICENSVTGEKEVDGNQGIRMIHVGDNIWSYDVPTGFDRITFLDNVDTYPTHTTSTLELNPEFRYYGVDEAWYDVPTTIQEFENDVRIFDANIHDLVKDNTGIMGFGFPLVGKDSAGKYKYSFLVLDNIYPTTTKVGDNSVFALTFGLNLNGTETQLVLPCVQDVSYVAPGENAFGVRFDISNATMYYGNVEVPEVKSILDSMISGAAATSSFISFDKNAEGKVTSMTLSIDLNELVSTGDFKNLHDTLTDDDPTSEYACNAKLFLNIIPVVNPVEEQAEKGIGGFKIEVGYTSKDA